MRWLSLFFFLSGFPALIYQIIWQRALFGVFGSNIEAVTLVVSAFMLGLGLGSYVGGRLSASPRFNPLLLFALFEGAIAVFGFFSLDLIATVGSMTIGVGLAGTFAAAFLTVLIPTFLMGATLPLLVTWLVRLDGQVGRSVGLLYSLNTWGSAAACFLGALLVFGMLGMQGAVYLSAAINAAVGTGALLLLMSSRSQGRDGDESSPADPIAPTETRSATPALSMPLALALVALSGFVSLSFEIVWTRAFYLAFEGRAFAFPLVLGLFLAGLAFGAGQVRTRGDKFREALDRNGLLPFVLLLLAASVIAYAVLPAMVRLGLPGFGIGAALIVASAACFGAILPLVSDAAIAAGRDSGRKVSHLYLANIAGSTIGTVATGLVLLDQLSLHGVAAALLTVGILASSAMLVRHFLAGRALPRPLVLAVAASPVLVVAAPLLHEGLYETLQFKQDRPANYNFARIEETRSGVVTITDGNVVFGSGVYDGRAEIDLVSDRNGLFRVTAIAAVHDAPKEVLVIGLSAAAWTQILVNLPGVEKITAVEINPGYLSLIRHYPDLRSVLDNPKIDIVIDDGRRWLRANPERKFDVIVANTTFHWRAGASNLLSMEYLDLIRGHLKPDGLYFFNSTSSDMAQKTAAMAFPHAARLEHFVFTGERPIAFDKARWLAALESLEVDGRDLLDFDVAPHRNRAREIVALADSIGPLNREDELSPALEFRDSILQRTGHLPVITDDNMGAEWPVPSF